MTTMPARISELEALNHVGNRARGLADDGPTATTGPAAWGGGRWGDEIRQWRYRGGVHLS